MDIFQLLLLVLAVLIFVKLLGLGFRIAKKLLMLALLAAVAYVIVVYLF